MPLVDVLSKIEANGIEVNKKFLTTLSSEFENESKILEKKFLLSLQNQFHR